MKLKFDLIENIDPNDPKSWSDRVFLTLDIDWACDEVISYVINLLEDYNIPATWFVTHKTKILDSLLKNPNFRLGIHPNFNPILDNNSTGNISVDEILKSFDNFLPKTKFLRSHSLLQSEKILDDFKKNGYEYICNTYIPYSKNISISPWHLWDDLKIIPHCWQDNVSLRMNNLEYINFNPKNLNVFNFHPIHIFLNTEHINRYNSAKKFQNDFSILEKKVNNGFGVYKILKNLIKKSR